MTIIIMREINEYTDLSPIHFLSLLSVLLKLRFVGVYTMYRYICTCMNNVRQKNIPNISSCSFFSSSHLDISSVEKKGTRSLRESKDGYTNALHNSTISFVDLLHYRQASSFRLFVCLCQNLAVVDM